MATEAARRDSLRLMLLTPHGFVERDVPPALELLAMLKQGHACGEASISPADSDFPRAMLSFHYGHGFVFQYFANERAWSDFLVEGKGISTPHARTMAAGAVRVRGFGPRGARLLRKLAKTEEGSSLGENRSVPQGGSVGGSRGP